MAAPNMGHSVIRVVNFFVVVILIIVLLNLVGPLIANSAPHAIDNAGQALRGIWRGLQGLVPDSYYGHSH
ncbi:MAG: hypothetical protein ACRDQU_14595 [Pseudonocardiaceae bacterium]